MGTAIEKREKTQGNKLAFEILNIIREHKKRILEMSFQVAKEIVEKYQVVLKLPKRDQKEFFRTLEDYSIRKYHFNKLIFITKNERVFKLKDSLPFPRLKKLIDMEKEKYQELKNRIFHVPRTDDEGKRVIMKVKYDELTPPEINKLISEFEVEGKDGKKARRFLRKELKGRGIKIVYSACPCCGEPFKIQLTGLQPNQIINVELI